NAFMLVAAILSGEGCQSGRSKAQLPDYWGPSPVLTQASRTGHIAARDIVPGGPQIQAWIARLSAAGPARGGAGGRRPMGSTRAWGPSTWSGRRPRTHAARAAAIRADGGGGTVTAEIGRASWREGG